MDSKSSIKIVGSQLPSPLNTPKTSDLEPATPTKSTEKIELESKKSQHNQDSKSLAEKIEKNLSFTPTNKNDSSESTFDQEKSFKESSASVDGVSGIAKTSGNAKNGEKIELFESGKSSMCRGSTSTDVSDESSCSSLSSSISKPHKSNDSRWEAIQAVRSKDGVLGLSHFRLLKRLGCGDIGSVYLSELSGTKSYFAMKVMDKDSLESRKKLLRAQTEREILQSLDHPFLPTLYTHFETDKFSCLVMEFCPGGDLHTLRQRQPGKRFCEQAVKFYVAEILLAMEYLHMLGIIYRDLKPENVLVREDGHIMLSDFDLSLRCSVSPTLVKSASLDNEPLRRNSAYCVQPTCIEPPSCIQPSCVVPTSCFSPRLFMSKSKKESKSKPKNKPEIRHQVTPLPELMAEPTGARSMSFVGTHEYLAPEIIKNEGHGSAVDWCGKPEPPHPTNYTYDPLPSTPQPAQYYVVLPFYSPSGHRRYARLCRRYFSCATAVLLLAVAVYFLWPSDPYLKVVNLRVDRLNVHATPKISLDITLGVTIKVRNPDVYSLDFRSLNVSVGYRGEQLGFVTSDDGKVKAFGTSYIDATLVLNGAEVISEAIFLIEDLVKGSIPFTTTSEIRGSLGILFFNLPIEAKLSCEVLMNTHNQTIERQDCYPA